jgi:CBS domain-containing protein
MAPAQPRMTLAADTAADLMTPNPVSINATASVQEAIGLLTDRGFGATAVLGEAGRPAGVVSSSDVLVHQREQVRRARLQEPTAPDVPPRHRAACEVGDVTPVRDIMTPAVFTVTPTTPADQVVEQMLLLRVHHLFVVDDAGILVGVISPLDILRSLRAG